MRLTANKVALPMIVLAILAGTSGVKAATDGMTDKLQAYIHCINRLSERAYESRDRYLGWAGKQGPRSMRDADLGLYTIYDTKDCREGVEKANAEEPHDAGLEQAGSAYVKAVTELEPLLQTADDYYSQGNFKDDKLKKGKEMHPGLIAAFAAFAATDQALRASIEAIDDKAKAEQLAEVEKAEGHSAKFLALNLMQTGKALLQTEDGNDLKKMDVNKINMALPPYEAAVKELDAYAGAHENSPFDSIFVDGAKSYLTSAKELMRRVRDKVKYSQGEMMMLDSGQGAWMVDGSPARVLRDYNELVDRFNSLRI